MKRDQTTEERREPAKEQVAPRTRIPLFGLRDDLGDLFGDWDPHDFMRSWRRLQNIALQSRFGSEITQSPNVDIVEKEDMLELTAEVPGMSARDIEVELRSGVLILRGQRSEEARSGELDEEFFVRERSYGSFQRAIRLPSNIETENIDAHVANGILTVHLPKMAEGAKARTTIEVKDSK